ncbi:MAG: HD-GYP domain-containing protein [Planctomycetes bacterium]|nr:HD-GYP domain-containing protein [Planctomycetota bacterium]
MLWDFDSASMENDPILTALNDAVCLFNPKSGSLIVANPPACDLFECDLEQARNMNLADLCLHHAACSGHHSICELKQVYKGKCKVIEWRPPESNNAAKWVELKIQTITIGENDFILAVLRDLSPQKRLTSSLQNSTARLSEQTRSMVESIAHAVDVRCPATAQHQRCAAILAESIATEMKLPEHQISSINIAASLHDVGKIGIPGAILNKPDRLNPDEFEIMKSHSEIGHQILSKANFDSPVADIVHQHHERIDGSGYPYGLRNDEIMLEARIIAVADVIDAISSDRPYRKSASVADAIQFVSLGSGSFFDREVVNATISIYERNEKSFRELQDA